MEMYEDVATTVVLIGLDHGVWEKIDLNRVKLDWIMCENIITFDSIQSQRT